MNASNFDVLEDKAEVVAPRLLGSILTRQISSRVINVRIVETEAYDQADAASHSFKGQTPRTSVMFGPPGFLYVYFTYGMHYCCNIVVGKNGYGSAVLIRAVEPISGEELMSLNRVGIQGVNISDGPAKLAQALKIDKALNKHDLKKVPLTLEVLPGLKSNQIVKTTRIGISREKDKLLRFYIKNNPYVSNV